MIAAGVLGELVVLGETGSRLSGIAAPAPRAPGDARQGSTAAIAVVVRVCPAVKMSTGAGSGTAAAGAHATAGAKLYDCQGRSAAILAAAAS